MAIERDDVVETLASLVINQAAWQIQALRKLDRPVVIFVDEPALRLVANHREPIADLGLLRRVLQGIRDAGGIAGLHCCALVATGQLCVAQPDILSFDAVEGLHPTVDDERTLEFWSNGGTMAFGLVSTEEAGPVTATEELFTRWLLAGSHLDGFVDLAARTMITATCGLGLQNPAAGGIIVRSGRRAEPPGPGADPTCQRTVYRHATTDGRLTGPLSGESLVPRQAGRWPRRSVVHLEVRGAVTLNPRLTIR